MPIKRERDTHADTSYSNTHRGVSGVDDDIDLPPPVKRGNSGISIEKHHSSSSSSNNHHHQNNNHHHNSSAHHNNHHNHHNSSSNNTSSIIGSATNNHHLMRSSSPHHDDIDGRSDISTNDHSMNDEPIIIGARHLVTSSPRPSSIRHNNNGIENGSMHRGHNTNNDAATSATVNSSPVTLLSGMQFKITSRGMFIEICHFKE